jgi:subtilisin family serine protease
MEKHKIFTLFSLILVTSVHFFDGVLANPGAEIPGEWIIRMQDTAAESTFEKELATAGVSSLKRLVPSIPIYLGKNSDSRSLEKVTMSKLNSLKSVKYAHPNHKVTKREKNPNDPEFSKSYSLKNNVKAGADTKATFAWEIGTGGKDFVGNDIVVAVVDGGVDVEHQDLKANAWVNLKEVAGNKLDDDENGFVDDIHGWNAYDNSGNTGADDHGTHVAGIIGAQGDNALFTSGVNWNVKLMAVDGASGNTATVTFAYG